MMGSNAKVIWSVDYRDFPAQQGSLDKLKFLLRYAILAPSGHNTQPWIFSIKGEAISIFANLKKRLFVMDPVSRELYLSLGACIANLKMAAEAFGVKAETSYFPKGATSSLAATVSLPDLAMANLTDPTMLSAMLSRRNNREHYHPDPIKDEIMDIWAGFVADPSLRLHLVSDPAIKEKIAGATAQGLRLAFANKSFRAELASWIRNNYVYCEDGIPVNTTDMPAPSLIAAALIRFIDIGPIKARNDRKKMLESPMIAVVSSQDDGPLAWVKAGELFEKIQVSAAGSGIASAVLAAAVEEGELYKKIREAIDTDYRPQMIFRLGYPAKGSLHAPRVPVEKLLINDE